MRTTAIIILWVLLLGICRVPVSAEPILEAQDIQALIRRDLKEGRLDPDTALLTRFQYVFAPQDLPDRYRPSGFSPLPCATDLVRDFAEAGDHLTPSIRRTIDTYLAWAPSRAVHNSDGGHFRLYYDTTGVDAVPAEDTSPVNGVPDFVEKVAGYLETAWHSEFETLDFLAPVLDDGCLEVGFAAMSAYGYTSVVNADQGLCRLILHNDFEGFPANDDPEGSVWGAAKVTAAHELKHASQYRGSRWSEGEWIELDAVWVEDLVYDQVNDYYNFLVGENPLMRPDVPLPGADGDGGSYEDCIFQHWLSQSWGVDIVRDFWTWRQTHRSEAVMASWSQMLAAQGTDLVAAWPMFCAWNYGTGYRAVTGLGYEEAAAYPYGWAAATATSYPFTHTGEVAYLAAEFIKLSDLSAGAGELGAVRIRFDGQAGADLTLAAHIRRGDGTGLIEVLALDDDNQADGLLSVPLNQIDVVGLVIGNARTTPGNATYDLTVSRDLDLPDPVITVAPLDLTVDLDHDEETTTTLTLSNTGPEASHLDYRLRLQGNEPEPAKDKSVSGSTLTSATETYPLGATETISLTVANGSSDDEWLTDVVLELPAGVTVEGVTDFVGGSLGDLVGSWTRSSTASGAREGEQVVWHGTYGSQGYGVIRDGESAAATITLAFAADLPDPLAIPWSITGDQFGANPHTVHGELELTAANLEITVTAPTDGQAVAIGASFDIDWTTTRDLSAVDIHLSRDGGETWQLVAEEAAAAGPFATVMTGPCSEQGVVRVTAADGSAAGTSDGDFVIYDPLTWVSCSGPSGRLTGGQAAALALHWSSLGLAGGIYPGFAVIDHNADDAPLVVPLQLRVDVPSPVPPPGVGLALLGNFPNPFNPRTVVQLELSVSTDVAVDVLDLRGRVVHSLRRGPLTAGRHELVWQGDDARGRPLPSGPYLVRARAAGLTTTHKVMLVR